jgi:hypothetical protein
MSDYRDTDLLGYILGGLVIAISGIAVGVASTNTKVADSENGANKVAVTVPTVVTKPGLQTSLANPSMSEQKGREHAAGHSDHVQKTSR